jgi:hypothetical protein
LRGQSLLAVTSSVGERRATHANGISGENLASGILRRSMKRLEKELPGKVRDEEGMS